MKLKVFTSVAMLVLTCATIANAASSEKLTFTAEIDPNVDAESFVRMIMDNDQPHYYRPQAEVKFDLQLTDRVGTFKLSFVKLNEVTEPQLDTPPEQIQTFEVNARCGAMQEITGTSSVIYSSLEDIRQTGIKIFKVSCSENMSPVGPVSGSPGDVKLQVQKYKDGNVRVWMTRINAKGDLTYHMLAKKVSRLN